MNTNSRPTAPWLTRRGWLTAAIAGTVCPFVHGSDDVAKSAATIEENQIAEVRNRARQVGIEALTVGRTEHYLGIGNAPERFRDTALEICEGLAQDFLRHFAEKKLEVRRPTERLVIVILADPSAFANYLDLAPGGPVRGIYDLDTNRLVICDNRGENNPRAERANTVALFHEATHQLTFNTGLLQRLGDVPLCISEGLATYGEVRRPKGQVRIGAINKERLAVLAHAARQGRQLIPTADLMVHDDLLNDPDTQQLAYGQCWLMVHHFLQDSASLPRFRAYLNAIRARKSPDQRLDDAREHLGDLDRLDRNLARAANRLIRG